MRLDKGERLPPVANPSGVIVLGGTMGAWELDRYPNLRGLEAFVGAVVAAGIPLLGVCLGGQVLAKALGGEVCRRHLGERGVGRVRLTAASRNDPLFRGLPSPFSTFQWHEDSFELPPGGVLLVRGDWCRNQAFRYGPRAYGLQFHPEVDEATARSWAGAEEGDSVVDALREASPGYATTVALLVGNFLSLVRPPGP